MYKITTILKFETDIIANIYKKKTPVNSIRRTVIVTL